MKRLLILPILALALGACAIAPDRHDMMDMPWAVELNGYSSTDLMFAEMMIPHHQQAVVMSELALERSTNPEVRALAEEIRSAQAPEIEQMKSWGATGDEHMGHTMQGMLTEQEIQDLEASQGASFDRLFLVGMIKHHEGAIDMAQMVLASNNADVRTLGENIVSSQTAEIIRMRALLDAMP